MTRYIINNRLDIKIPALLAHQEGSQWAAPRMDEYRKLRTFVAGVVLDGLGGLLPVAGASDEEAARRRKVLEDDPESRQGLLDHVALFPLKEDFPQSTIDAMRQESLECEWAGFTWGCTRMFWGSDFGVDGLARDHTVLSFSTIGNPPRQWAKEIANCYPDWRFKLEYWDFDRGKKGVIEWDGSEVKEHQERCEQWADIAEEAGLPEEDPIDRKNQDAARRARKVIEQYSELVGLSGEPEVLQQLVPRLLIDISRLCQQGA